MHKGINNKGGSVLSRINLEVRDHVTIINQIAIGFVGLLIGLAISSLYLFYLGVDWNALINEFVISIFSNVRSLKAVLTYAAPLIIVGLAAAFGFRARFWNIGIEGQIIFGAIGATFIATYDIGPEKTRLLLMFLAAAIAGMLWIALPLFLRIKYQVNEIISTLLLNYVMFNFLLHLLYGPWKDPVTSFPNSKIFDEFERLPSINGFFDIGVSSSLLLAIAFVILSIWLLSISRFGFLLKFIYANQVMSKSMGVQVTKLLVISALISGALSGVAGFSISSGIDSRLTQSFFIGYGFSGILIGFLSKNNPLLIVFFSFLVAILIVAGQTLQVFYQIPFGAIQLIQATIVICIASCEFFVNYKINLVQ